MGFDGGLRGLLRPKDVGDDLPLVVGGGEEEVLLERLVLSALVSHGARHLYIGDRMMGHYGKICLFARRD